MNTLIAQYRKHLNPQYVAYLERNGLDKEIVAAEGAILLDSDGKEYVDLVAGYGVHNFGHNPPTVVQALIEVLQNNNLVSRPFLNPDLARTAERLCALSGMPDGRAFFCSTGAETVDTSIKLARISTRRPKIIAATGSFHGFTIGALSVSGINAQRAPFEPLMAGVGWVPFGDAEALDDAVDDQTAAILLEPVQAEIGGIAPPPGYLSAARKIASEAGALLILDEVRTGFWRTGRLFACEYDNVTPDVLLLGKSLGSGLVPVGAVVSDSRLHVRSDMTFSMSASSFAGNRLACTAAGASIGLARSPVLAELVHENASLAWRKAARMGDQYANVIDRVTGKGLLIGLHFRNIQLAQSVVSEGIARGVLVGLAFCNSKCLLLEPAVNIEGSILESALDVLDEVIREIASV